MTEITPEMIIAIFSSLSAVVTAVIATRSRVTAEELEALKGRMERIEKELNAERAKNAELTAVLDGYMSEKLAAKREILSLKLQLDERDAVIRRQESTIQDLELRVASLESELRGLYAESGRQEAKGYASGKDLEGGS